ncbi:MAG: M20/M25/M40 family metallo-hydrolase [Kiritimatiellales bacterium]|nr:M20/M25/M40 family metallo-hydrolase [Kiritimatiellales bacterium]
MPELPPEINRDRLFALFRDMVDIYSPSGKEEEIGQYVADYLEGQGLVFEKEEVDEDRFNLLVSTGNGAPDTLFLGHIDTVPAYDIERYDFSERDGLCYGLGTADMKSGCAAMIEAFGVAAQAGRLPDNVLLALVVGEEETGDGTRALLENRRFERALVAEPTDLKPCLNHYGYVEMTVRAFGSRRHAAMSGHDTNAIHSLLRCLIQLEDRLEKNEPETVLNIRDLHSSESGFAVPDRCAAEIDLHLPPGTDVKEYANQLRGFVEEQLTNSRASRHEIQFPTLADGYRVDPRDSVPQRLEKIYSELGLAWEPDAFRSHSDANLLRDAGCSPVILGPGQLAKAHTRDESVDFEQVARAAQIYSRLLFAGG